MKCIFEPNDLKVGTYLTTGDHIANVSMIGYVYINESQSYGLVSICDGFMWKTFGTINEMAEYLNKEASGHTPLYGKKLIKLLSEANEV